MAAVIGIDIGTTTICAVALDLVTGNLLAAEQRPNDSTMATGKAWERTQDPARILVHVRELLRCLACRFRPVTGIGLTGQMHGILYVDVAGQAASPLYTWQDGRGDVSCRHGATYAQSMAAASGYPLASGMGVVTHYANCALGLVPAGAAGFCSIMDYAVMQLTGRTRPVCDPSTAASFGCFDLRQGVFDWPAVRALQLDPALFPPLAAGHVPVGRTADGLPVFCAMGDNQASFAGAVGPCDRETSVLLNVGTGSQVSVWSPTCLRLDGLESRPFPGGGFLLVGAPLCGGRAYALLRDFFRQTLLLFGAADAASRDLYAVMNASDSLPLSAVDGLRVDTAFSGTRTEPMRRGAIGNISVANLTPQHLVAGFAAGMAEELHELFLKVPAALREQRSHLVGAGNGIRSNPLLRQALTERFGRTLTLAPYAEEAACGAARLAGAQAVSPV